MSLQRIQGLIIIFAASSVFCYHSWRNKNIKAINICDDKDSKIKRCNTIKADVGIICNHSFYGSAKRNSYSMTGNDYTPFKKYTFSLSKRRTFSVIPSKIRRGKPMGIRKECCENPCSNKHLTLYCLKDPCYETDVKVIYLSQ